MKFGRIEKLDGEYEAIIEVQTGRAVAGVKVGALVELQRQAFPTEGEALSYLKANGVQFLD